MGSEEVYQYNHNPSRWLKDYMAETYRVSWSTEEKWWVSSQDAKYQAASKKQRTTKKTATTKEISENVVQVNFGKKDES